MPSFSRVLALLLLLGLAAALVSWPAVGRTSAGAPGPSLPSGAPRQAALASLTPTGTPSPTPVPWDDIMVNDPQGKALLLSNEAMFVSGPNVYVAYAYNTGVYFTRSTNGGISFLPSVQISSVPGTPTLTRREGAGQEDYSLYMVFAEGRRVYFSDSTDRGDTWQTPVVVRDGTSDDTWPENAKIAVDREGVIYVTWHHWTNTLGGPYFLSRSTDGGGTWSEMVPVTPPTTIQAMPEGCSLVGHNGTLSFLWSGANAKPGSRLEVRLTKSVDGGQSWSTPVRVDDAGDETNKEMVDLAVGPGGVLYAAWDDDRNGLFQWTYVARSTNDGATWSPGVLVIDAGEHARESGSGAITVDKAGTVHVVLQDGRDYGRQASSYIGNDVFYTNSTDGGMTWSPNVQISNPVPNNLVFTLSIQVQGKVVYTMFEGRMPAHQGPRIWLDIRGPHLAPLPTITLTPSPTVTRSPIPTIPPTMGQERLVYLPRVEVGSTRVDRERR